MKTKKEIVENWLPRYTGMKLEEFGRYIILVNFSNYVKLFADWHNVPVKGEDRSMQCATSNNITIINFGMGSPNAATVMDLLTAIMPKAVLFLGKCGGLRHDKNKVGDMILPIAAIRGEGTSNDYMPPEVPALPAFAMQKAISTTVRDYEQDYWTGTVYTTNRRVWEHKEDFKEYLRELRCMAIDMETATILSDIPMIPEGVKTEENDKKVTSSYAERHLKIGIDSLNQLMNNGLTVRHLKF
jgi:AMP nucleosidase